METELQFLEPLTTAVTFHPKIFKGLWKQEVHNFIIFSFIYLDECINLQADEKHCNFHGIILSF